jgi:hypothetical protein
MLAVLNVVPSILLIPCCLFRSPTGFAVWEKGVSSSSGSEREEDDDNW